VENYIKIHATKYPQDKKYMNKLFKYLREGSWIHCIYMYTDYQIAIVVPFTRFYTYALTCAVKKGILSSLSFYCTRVMMWYNMRYDPSLIKVRNVDKQNKNIFSFIPNICVLF